MRENKNINDMRILLNCFIMTYEIPFPKRKGLSHLFTDTVNSEVDDKPKKENYHYEIGKIGSKRNPMDFDFFGGILRKKCLENELVLNELNHMEQNIWDEIEYYTSYRLICSELKEE